MVRLLTAPTSSDQQDKKLEVLLRYNAEKCPILDHTIVKYLKSTSQDDNIGLLLNSLTSTQMQSKQTGTIDLCNFFFFRKTYKLEKYIN